MESDDALVVRCRDRGDEEAFAELVARHRERVFRLVLSILGQGFAGEAEEVTQDVFLRVHHALRSFRGEAKFSSWLYRIAFNQAINLKAHVRYRVPHVSDAALAESPSCAAGPHETAHVRERAAALAECIAELPEVYQSALRLHYWMGMSIDEIARLLDAPDNTIKSYLLRARRLIASMLATRGHDDV